MTSSHPTFRDLTRAEAEEVLARNHVGRLAFIGEDHQVDITPIHYVFADGMLHGRTAAGTKLSVVAHRPWVAFETDEVEAAYRWRSVVVRGTIFRLDADHTAKEYTETIELIRRVAPAALTPDDPTPLRDVLFRIDVGIITGRAADDRTPQEAS
jgi:nitroimidazol reductase NimA-like FMN-containing flavoprotein (pyridoxamine 5'-phosphate oxidase superfamily)